MGRRHTDTRFTGVTSGRVISCPTTDGRDKAGWEVRGWTRRTPVENLFGERKFRNRIYTKTPLDLILSPKIISIPVVISVSSRFLVVRSCPSASVKTVSSLYNFSGSRRPKRKLPCKDDRSHRDVFTLFITRS